MDKQFVEYVWLGGTCWDIRSKTKILSTPVNEVSQLSTWNYDGSSTGQAETSASEVLLRPVKIIKDPFRGSHHIIAYCETYLPDGTPTHSNFRSLASQVFQEQVVVAEEVWFGVEQEYILAKQSETNELVPLAWVNNKTKQPQGVFYCGVGAGKAIARHIPEEHMVKCLEAGLDLAGINAEVFPG